MLPARYLHGAGAIWRARAAWGRVCAGAARERRVEVVRTADAQFIWAQVSK